MKILTWNVERLKHSKKSILDKIEEFKADIIVLTETSSELTLNANYNSKSTKSLNATFDNVTYKLGENRTTIWTKYRILKSHKTFDNFTSVWSEIETEFGILNVYGTIIGVFGGKGTRFETDLNGQLNDFENFDKTASNCIIGDLNIYFSGYAYPSHKAKNTLNQTFERLEMENFTSEIEENVDHIIISKEFVKNKIIQIETWNLDKKLSDHKGICITIKEKEKRSHNSKGFVASERRTPEA